ncbi:MAG: ABC transporter permease [Oscillospiraceae bacterium]|nr:ABC transporter permease [Oscillospiraceae bacterium]
MNKVTTWFKNFIKYQPLLRELVKRDLKVRYRHSFLGILWTVLNPLLNMLVMTFVFSNMFKMDIENFALYVMIGNVVFSFTSESTMSSMNSIVWNASLIKKVYIPKYMFPLSNIISALVNFSFSFIAMILVMLFTGAKFYGTIITVWIPLLYLMVFCYGVGLFLCSINVFFRDMSHLYSVFINVWMYASAIFYSTSILSKELLAVVEGNPLYQYITFFREIIMEGRFPSAGQNLVCIAWSLGALLVGSLIFNRTQKKYILHI